MMKMVAWALALFAAFMADREKLSRKNWFGLLREAMDRQLRQHANSVHEVSLADLRDMVRLTDRLPERCALVGIEPAVLGWDDRLTPSVEAAVPIAMARVQEILRRWALPSV